MKQQVLESRMAEIEAIATNAIRNGDHVSALLAILKIVGRDK